MATKYSYSTSSSGFIGGLPVAAAAVKRADAVDILSEAVKVVLKDGTKSLQKQLRKSALWEPYADKVEIRWDEDKGEFTYVFLGTPEENDHMRDLEYGTPDLPPTSMIRKHAFRLKDEVGKEVSARVTQVVGLGR